MKKDIGLWLGIATSCLIGLGMILLIAVLGNASDKPQPVEASPAAQTTITPGSLLTEVNKRRAEAGIAPLTVDTRLANSAQAKSSDMKSRNYFDHTDPDGKHGYEFIWENYSKDGIEYASENLQGMCARDNTKSIVDAWMASEPHKKALLDSRYTITGFGISLDNSSPEDEYCNGNVVEHFVEVRKAQPQTNIQNNYSTPSRSMYCDTQYYSSLNSSTTRCF